MGTKALEDFMNCGNSYKIVYDCIKGEQIFGDDLIKNKICKKIIVLSQLLEDSTVEQY